MGEVINIKEPENKTVIVSKFWTNTILTCVVVFILSISAFLFAMAYRLISVVVNGL